MFNKPTALILVIAVVFTVVAWSSGAIDIEAACADQARLPKDKPEVHGNVGRSHELDTEGDGSDDSTIELRFAYDVLDEGRLR